MIIRIEKLLNVRRHEWKLLGPFFFLNLLIYAGIFSGRGIRDALFFSNISPQYLPLIFIINAITLTIISTLFSRWTSGNFSKKRLLYGSFVFSLVIITTFGFLMNFIFIEAKWQYFVFYFITEIPIFLSLNLIWILAEDYYSEQMGQRLFPHIVGGGHIGIILGGSIILFLPSYFGTHKLIFFWSFFIISQIFLVFFIFRSKFSPRNIEADEEQEVSVSLKESLNNNFKVIKNYKYLVTFVIITGCNFFLMAAFDFRLNQTANVLFEGNPDMLATILGYFTVGFGGISALIQFSLINRLIEKLTIPKANLFAPSLFVLGAFILFLFTTDMMGPLVQLLKITLHAFYFVAIARFAGYIAEYLFNQTLIQFIYGAIPSKDRNAARFFIEGSFTSLVIGVTGLFLIAYNFVFKYQIDFLTTFCLVAASLMLWASIKLMDQYREILKKGYLKVKGVGDILKRIPKLLENTKTARWIIEKLNSSEPFVVKSTIELLSISATLKPIYIEELEKLVTHKSSEVRSKAIEVIAKYKLTDSFQRILEKLINFEKDSGGIYRIKNLNFSDIKTLRSLFYGLLNVPHNLDIVSIFSILLKDRRSEVIGEAILLLARSGMDGVYSSVGALRKLLISSVESKRRIGIEVIGELGTDSFSQEISSLISNSEMMKNKYFIEVLGKINFQNKNLLVNVFDQLLSNYNQSFQKQHLKNTISAYVEKFPFLGLALWARLFQNNIISLNDWLTRAIPSFLKKMYFSGNPEIITEFINAYPPDRNENLHKKIIHLLKGMCFVDQEAEKSPLDLYKLLEKATPNKFFNFLLSQSDRDLSQRLGLIDSLHYRILSEIEKEYLVDKENLGALFQELLKMLYLLAAIYAVIEEETLGSYLASAYEPILQLIQIRMKDIRLGLFQILGCLYPDSKIPLFSFSNKVFHPDRFIRDDAVTYLEQEIAKNAKNIFDDLKDYISIQDFAPYQDKILYRKKLNEKFGIFIDNHSNISKIISTIYDPFMSELFNYLKEKNYKRNAGGLNNDT